MNGWILMQHRNYTDFTQAHGDLMGGFYSDIESACRAITDDWLINDYVVSVEYQNDGEKALITTSKGAFFGAYMVKMPMREDMPTWGVR